MNARTLALSAVLALALPAVALADDNEADLAKKLSNPVASLVSVPFQLNYDEGYGPDGGGRTVLNIQPVVPVALNADWNLIVRTIVPVIHQARPAPSSGAEQGLGDTTQSFFFSPAQPRNGLTWAVGPVFLWPTGSAELGSKTWGAGPSVLILKQQGGYTYGVLANHVWSYAEVSDHSRPGVSTTFLQPFLNWTSPTALTVGISTESTYNWKNKGWTVPVNLTVSQLYKFGARPVSLGATARVYAAREDQGPEWGLRFNATFLFPR